MIKRFILALLNLEKAWIPVVSKNKYFRKIIIFTGFWVNIGFEEVSEWFWDGLFGPASLFYESWESWHISFKESWTFFEFVDNGDNNCFEHILWTFSTASLFSFESSTFCPRIKNNSVVECFCVFEIFQSFDNSWVSLEV